jgi:hypothetical protein
MSMFNCCTNSQQQRANNLVFVGWRVQEGTDGEQDQVNQVRTVAHTPWTFVLAELSLPQRATEFPSLFYIRLSMGG